MKYHFIGIKGSGMSALAHIIFDLGNEVQGSDVDRHLFTQDALEKKGIKILSFDENNIKDNMIIVLGNAFSDEHEEVKRAKELNLVIYRYYDLLGELVKKFNTVSICGCHGKTTVTAMLSYVLNNTIGTNYLIGDGTGCANKNNERFVMEACEYKRTFLNYYPKDIIITNVELDHVDYYKDLDDIINAYTEFLSHASNRIIACGDDKNIRKIKIDKEVIYYGLSDNNDVIAKNIILNTEGSKFDCYYKGEYLESFTIKSFGKHMILNALSIITYSYLNGVDLKDIKKYLLSFVGAKRRFTETIVDELVIVDDYAHHPTEIKVTIESARQKYPNKEIIAVFFENTFSRTLKFYKEFAAALNTADKSYITDIFSDREKQEDFPEALPQLILDLLNNGEHMKIGTFDNLIDENNYEFILPLIQHKKSVILFMGCKEVYYIKERFQKYLEEV